MTKTTTPLFSFNARGTLKKLLTFRRSKSGTIAESIPTHPDAKSEEQLTWRTMYQACSLLWNNLTQPEKLIWNQQARAKKMTGYNWFMSQCLRPNPGIYLPLAGGHLTGDVTITAGKTIDAIDISAHAAALDAHTFNLGQTLRTGTYLSPIGIANVSNTAIAANRLIFRYLWIARNITVDQIAAEITAGGGAGKVLRLGFYDITTNLRPGALLLDAGTIDANSATLQAITLAAALTLTKGWHGVALFSNGTPTIKGFSSWWSPAGMHSTNLNYTYAHWYKDTAYGALPNPFPIDASPFDFTYCAFPRVASLI